MPDTELDGDIFTSVTTMSSVAFNPGTSFPSFRQPVIVIALSRGRGLLGVLRDRRTRCRCWALVAVRRLWCGALCGVCAFSVMAAAAANATVINFVLIELLPPRTVVQTACRIQLFHSDSPHFRLAGKRSTYPNQ